MLQRFDKYLRKTLTIAELGAKWKSLTANEKSVWVKKSNVEANRTKVMNKGAVQRTIKAPIEVCPGFLWT